MPWVTNMERTRNRLLRDFHEDRVRLYMRYPELRDNPAYRREADLRGMRLTLQKMKFDNQYGGRDWSQEEIDSLAEAINILQNQP